MKPHESEPLTWVSEVPASHVAIIRKTERGYEVRLYQAPEVVCGFGGPYEWLDDACGAASEMLEAVGKVGL